MQTQPKVINLSFQSKLFRKVETRSSQIEEKQQQDIVSMEEFMRSDQCMNQMYQLLRIIKSEPMRMSEIKNKFQLSVKKQSKNEQIPVRNRIKNNTEQLQTIILPQVDLQKNHQKDQSNNGQSIDEDKKDQNQATNVINIKGQQEQMYYVIPANYQQNLHFLLTHFLKFQIYNHKSIENPMRLSTKTTKTRRPKTTCKTIPSPQTQTINIFQNKPSTAINQNRTINLKQRLTFPSTLTQDFNEHLQKIILMEKQIQKKSKRIIFLENQLLTYTQIIKDKNHEIKELQQKQISLKKKVNYEIDKIMKGKVLTDINEIFLSNLSQQNNYGKSIFQINGKKYIKTDDIPSYTQSAFMTSPKMSIFSRSNEINYRSPDSSKVETLKKSQSTALIRKSKGVNKKLQIIKLTKLIESLKKEVQKYEQQKSQMFDKLSQNNLNIQKYIEKIQSQIQLKKSQIGKFNQEMQKLKQP